LAQPGAVEVPAQDQDGLGGAVQGPPTGAGAPSSTKYDISPTAERETWADGLSFDCGLAQDAKYRNPGGSRSFYDPSSLPPGLREFAVGDMDRRLLKYAAAMADDGNPLRALEIVTNDVGVAQFLRGGC
jgi:hypothetical protein